jgi:hypothetical protein
MTAIARHLFRALFETNADRWVILMFIVGGLLITTCLTLALGPRPVMG